jgi:Protein of unknown function (DUF4235)
MAKKKKKNANAGGQLFVTLTSTGVSLVMRKVLGAGWTKVRGKEPPIDLTDPRVTFGEAIGWAVLLGIVVETARFFVIRAVAKRALPEAGDAE